MKNQCPKCGHGGVPSEICNKCGLIFSKYYEVQARKKIIAEELSNQPGVHTGSRIGPLHCGVLLLFMALIFLGAINLGNEKKSDREITYEIALNVKAAKFDSAKELVRKYYNGDVQSANYWRQFITEREDLNSYLRNGKKYFREGVRLSGRRDFEGAVEKFEAALKNLEKGNQERSIALISLNLATCYRMLRNNRDSLAYFEDALDISRENGFEKYEAKALQGIGLIYNHLDQYEQALTYLEEALARHEVLNDKRGQAFDWLIMGIIEDNRNGTGAEIFFRRALAISKEIGYTVVEIRAGRLIKKRLNRGSESTPVSSSSYRLETL